MWPDGARCAAAFTFDFDAEEVWIGEDPENAGRPGVLSQGTYGAKVAVPLILDLLARHGVQATFFVPGRVAERHPERVAAIVAAGHEIAHHGYTHTSPHRLTPGRGGDRAGPRPGDPARLRGRGDRVPRRRRGTSARTRWTCCTSTASSYSSNLMDDIRPYRHRRPAAGRGADRLDPGRRRRTSGSTARAGPRPSHDRAGARPCGRRSSGHPGAGRGLHVHHAPADHRPARRGWPSWTRSCPFVTGHDDVWVTTTAQIASCA